MARSLNIPHDFADGVDHRARLIALNSVAGFLNNNDLATRRSSRQTHMTGPPDHREPSIEIRVLADAASAPLS